MNYRKTLVKVIEDFCGYFFLSLLVVTVVMLLLGYRSEIGPLMVLMFSSAGLYSMGREALKGFAFTIWVFVFVAASMFYPWAFETWFDLDLKHLIIPLIQIIMFGMGTTLSIADFGRVFKMPRPVGIGIVLQFTIMPLTGLVITRIFGFEAEVAAGVILIGSCPGGVASNLMTFLAGGDVALSVTMTSCSTLMSPIMTPFMMKMLAGKLVPINFIAMMLSIFNMIIVPILAGLLANRVLYSKKKWANDLRVLSGISISAIVLAILSLVMTEARVGRLATLRNGLIIGFALIGIVALAKLVVSILLKRSGNWMDKVLPVVSMAGICFIIGIITARSRDKLLSVAAVLIAAVIIHNFIGYILGYWCARVLKLNEKTCRTVAFEVGMQNGGMASGLAMTVLNSAHAALAPAIFGPWMNISGSVLATWWHRKPVKDREKQNAGDAMEHEKGS